MNELDLDDSYRDPDLVPTKKDFEEAQCDSSYSSDEESSTTPSGVLTQDSVEAIDHEEIVQDAPLTEKTRKRKCKNETDWEGNIQKKLWMKGKKYKGMTKKDGNWGYFAEKSERLLSPRCCSTRCEKSKKCPDLSEDDRQEIFKNFWDNLNWDEKKMYIISLVKIEPV